jgi:hypothetical protein
MVILTLRSVLSKANLGSGEMETKTKMIVELSFKTSTVITPNACHVRVKGEKGFTTAQGQVLPDLQFVIVKLILCFWKLEPNWACC